MPTTPKSRSSKKHFHGQDFYHVMRDLKLAVDVLAKLGSDRAQVPSSVFFQELDNPSIKGQATDLKDSTTQINK